MSSAAHDEALLQAARQVRFRAYAPYSQFKVGAALRLKNNDIIVGVNLENVSYGLTVCAERNALAAAVAAGAAQGDVQALAIAADAAAPTPPCGACRQVLAELAPDDLPIYLVNVRDETLVRWTLGELLPHAFRPANLPKP